MYTLSCIGTKLADESFNANGLSRLRPFLHDMGDCANPRKVEAAALVLMSAALRLAELLEATQRAGVEISPRPPTRSELEYLAASGDTVGFFGKTRVVFDTSERLWSACPGIAIAAPATRSAEAPVELPAEPVPTEINLIVRVQMPDAMRTEIIGMPARETVSSVERDLDGNIVRTAQVERDAVTI